MGRRSKDKNGRPRIGLCLSSGGARGLAHVGVIEVLEEAGVEIAAVAGTSMGAYVGALMAAGLSAADLHRLAAEISGRRELLRLMDPLIPPSAGLIRGEKMRRHLERSLGSKNFGDLKKPLLVVATDLDALEPHVFESGSVAQAVHASASIPGVFAPVIVDGHRFIDGGAADPLPVTLLKQRAKLDFVIAVNVLPRAQDHVSTQPVQGWARWLGWLNLLGHGNVMDTFHRSLVTAQRQLVAKEAAAADVVIHPDLPGSHWYDYENFETYIAAGRRAASEALPSILALMDKEPQPPPNHENIFLTPSGMGLHAA